MTIDQIDKQARWVLGHQIRVLSLLSFLFLLFCSKDADAQNSDRTRITIPAQTISDLVQLSQLRSSENRAVSLTLPSQNGDLTFSLEASDNRAANFRAVFDDGRQLIPDTSTSLQFKGRIEGTKRFVRLSLSTDRTTNERTLSGMMGDGENYYTLATTPGTSLSVDVTTLTPNQVNSLLASCASFHHPEQRAGLQLPQNLAELKSASGTTRALHVLEVDTESDYENYVRFGGDPNTKIRDFLDIVSGIYETEISVTVVVRFQHSFLSPSAQPYSTNDPTQLLEQFRTFWTQSYLSSQSGDVVHFFTGRSITSPTIGIAYVEAACTSYRFGVSTTSQQRVTELQIPLLNAHEIGHNLGADHDPCQYGVPPEYVMCPYINPSRSFSPVSKSAISSYIATGGSCLSVIPSGPPTNLPPTFSAVPNQGVSENQTLTFAVNASDPEGGAVTLSFNPQLQGLSLSGNTVTYSPNYSTVSGGASSANKVVTFTATDAQGASSSLAVNISVQNVNRPPTLANLSNVGVSEGSRYTLTLNASDPDADPLVFTGANIPYGGYLNRGNGNFYWTPRWNQAGVYTLTFTVTDSFGASSSRSMIINVSDTLSAPPPASLNTPTVFRPGGGMWYTASGTVKQFGLPGDVPFYFDFDGDGIPDRNVWRPSSGMWFSDSGISEQFGLFGDIPQLGDYDKDGIADLTVFRQSTGQFYVRLSSDQSTRVSSLGSPGDVPVVCDFDGDGKSDTAVFRPQTATWYVRNSSNSTVTSAQFGRPQDIPVPGPYSNTVRCNLAVWEADTATFHILEVGRIQLGQPGDLPAPADLDGDGRFELQTYRSSEGNWYRRDWNGAQSVTQLGLDTDSPVYSAATFYGLRHRSEVNPAALLTPNSASFYDRSNRTLYSASLLGVRSRSLSIPAGGFFLLADRDGEGTLDATSFLNGLWTFVLSSNVKAYAAWGQAGDIPMLFDGDGDKKADLTIWRPRDGNWWVVNSSSGLGRTFAWGLPGDLPISDVDYDGDGVSDPTVFRPAEGNWYVLDGRSGRGFASFQFGLPGDIPLTGDFDRDGRSDYAVFRQGFWFIKLSGGGVLSFQHGAPGDVPMAIDFFGEDRPSTLVYRPSNRVLFARSLNGTQKAVQLPTRAVINRRTRSINIQPVNLSSPPAIR